eukprot:350065-Chlamydomonas_euryale.AAC.6
MHAPHARSPRPRQLTWGSDGRSALPPALPSSGAQLGCATSPPLRLAMLRLPPPPPPQPTRGAAQLAVGRGAERPAAAAPPRTRCTCAARRRSAAVALRCIGNPSGAARWVAQLGSVAARRLLHQPTINRGSSLPTSAAHASADAGVSIKNLSASGRWSGCGAADGLTQGAGGSHCSTLALPPPFSPNKLRAGLLGSAPAAAAVAGPCAAGRIQKLNHACCVWRGPANLLIRASFTPDTQ